MKNPITEIKTIIVVKGLRSITEADPMGLMILETQRSRKSCSRQAGTLRQEKGEGGAIDLIRFSLRFPAESRE